MPAPDSEAVPRASQTGGPAADKDALRARARARRAASGHRREADAARSRRCLDVSAGHEVVACYASVAGEPDTWALIDGLLARGTRVLLPLLAGRRAPDWAWHTGPDALRPGWRGIPEPVGDALGPDALGADTLVWASALAVTADGCRLGTGGGWYDRALAFARPDATLGVLVDDDDVVETVPVEAWDRRVDLLVTPTRTLWTPGRGAARHGTGNRTPSARVTMVNRPS